jgi:hypothetical protein
MISPRRRATSAEPSRQEIAAAIFRTEAVMAQASDTIEASKALAELRKAQADAESAEASAATAKLKAAFGDAPSSPYTGAVTTADGACLAEMNYLARRRLEGVAHKIADSLKTSIGERTGVLVALTGPTALFGHYDALAARIGMARAACEYAHALGEAVLPAPILGKKQFAHLAEALSETVKVEGFAAPSAAVSSLPGATAGLLTAAFAPGPIAVASAAVVTANALLDFFRSNYAIGGAAMTVPDRALLVAVAGRLREASPSLPILIDGFLPPASAEARKALCDELGELAKLVATLGALVAKLERAIAAAAGAHKATAKPHGASATASEKGSAHSADSTSDGESDPRQDAIAAVKRAEALFEALQTDLFADVGGAPLIERAAIERTLRDRLGKTPLHLSLAVDGAWGSRVSRESGLSALSSRVPTSVSATVAANWAAFDLATGNLLAAGLETDCSPLINIANVAS